MSKYQVLYNPYSGSGWNDEKAIKIKKILKNSDLALHDITKIDTYEEFFSKEVDVDDNIVIVGGDGTLNRFVNAIDNIDIKNPILYIANGTGNDFLNDIEGNTQTPVELNKYLEDLPLVTVNGKSYKFINGIGYGIDGYCCEVGDEIKKKTDKPVNYTSIAIKGLLFYFHPVNATITVDGEKHTYKKVWLAPTMNGRFFGGGMMPTPNQDRMNKERTLSVLIWHGKGKLKTLMAFPKIFKGEHIKCADTCTVFTGHDICVEFDRPTALQVDGETIKGVLKYEARANKVYKASDK